MTADFGAAAVSRCEACGGMFRGGRAACQARFDALNGAAHQDPARAAAHWLAVDAYCMQHLDPYCRSAKSYAAHLMGLCWGVAHGGDRRGYAAIQRWLNGSRAIQKPELLSDLGALTLADVDDGSGPDYQASVTRWAASVWLAYTPQHALAHQWLRLALPNY